MKHQHLRNNMHTSTLALSVVALILFLLSGCGKDEIPGEEGNETITLEVSASPIHFAAEGGIKEITVVTNAKSWNVTSSKTCVRSAREPPTSRLLQLKTRLSLLRRMQC